MAVARPRLLTLAFAEMETLKMVRLRILKETLIRSEFSISSPTHLVYVQRLSILSFKS